MAKNLQVLVARLPKGKLSVEDYELVESALPEPGADEVRVETTAIAISAGTRAGLQGSASYAGAPKTGVVMNGTGVGRVVASRSDAVPEGVAVVAATGWQRYSVHPARSVQVVPDAHDPIDYLGPLGVNGLTAYFGLLDIGGLRAGETVLVSAAAGSVGHFVGQMAKQRDAHVVGVCGSAAKGERLVAELGYDAWVSHRSDDFRQELKTATAKGVDVYFDNTGGKILASALRRMKAGGRIVCCGVVSQYDTDTPEPGPSGVPGLLVNKGLTMRGFLVFEFAARFAEARAEIQGWLSAGTLRAWTDEVRGLAEAPRAFVDLLAGGNVGTRIVRLD